MQSMLYAQVRFEGVWKLQRGMRLFLSQTFDVII